MSTHDNDIEQLKRQQERVGQDHGHVRWTEAEKQPDGSYREGVAVPLEPLTPEKFIKQWNSFHIPDRHDAYWMEFAEAYAAAVSKNLQEELARAEDMIRHYLGSGYLPRMSAEEAREWLKEITALREKP